MRLLLAPLLLLPLASHAQPGPAGTWQGRYDCLQGSTGLTLTVQPGLRALFHFYALPGNPAVPEGCFEMQGTVGPEGEVRFTAGRWIVRPFGFVSVDLSGRLAKGGARLEGTVAGPGCTGFTLGRTAAPPPALPECRAASAAISQRE